MKLRLIFYLKKIKKINLNLKTLLIFLKRFFYDLEYWDFNKRDIIWEFDRKRRGRNWKKLRRMAIIEKRKI